ncbi:MAG TPA: aldo/keto reductase [Candidatus Acidoferrales bacterium]|nr:aldo/keto reductase [Candidatus Acidoferrales bacterium]
MRRKRFDRSDVELPAIGQGTWNFPESGARLDEAKRALLRGIELGMTHLDTAEMYGGGRVEELLGEILAGVPRDRLFVTTKVLPGNASYRGTLEAADRSLRRLRMEYVDLYLLHWPSDLPLEETMRGLEALVTSGKSRFIGVSNFETGAMVEAAEYLSAAHLSCNQVLYHLGERGPEHRLIPRARELGIAIVAYTPFGRGRTRVAGNEVLERIARKHGATARQVVLAFLTRDRNVFTIPKAATVAHVEENAGAGDLALDDDDLLAIDAAFPRGAPGPLRTL